MQLHGRLLIIFAALIALPLKAAETWPDALAGMPLGAAVRELNETNCVPVMLQAFRSNQVVKALIFLPGATDEFYLLHRARAQLTDAQPSLLDAVFALTNQTRIQATFEPPLLLLRTAADPVTPKIQIESPPTVQKLKLRLLPKAFCVDRDWDFVQPLLRWPLKVEVKPWQHSIDSYHFYRHNFAAFGLNGWQALSAAALAGKTQFTVRHNQVIFTLQ
jgi:hypothetical protein